jgi:hypothetical protein
MKLNTIILRLARRDVMEHMLPDLHYSTIFRKFLNDDLGPKDYLDTAYGFRDFLNAYGVGRTLKAGDPAKLKILKIIREHSFSNSHVQTIQTLAGHLQKKKLSSRSGTGTHGLPRSFVSKLLYVYRPDEIIPFDSYVLKSLETLTGRKLKTLDEYYTAADQFRMRFFPESGSEIGKLLVHPDPQFISMTTDLQFDIATLLSWKLTDKYLWQEHNLRRLS